MTRQGVTFLDFVNLGEVLEGKFRADVQDPCETIATLMLTLMVRGTIHKDGVSICQFSYSKSVNEFSSGFFLRQCMELRCDRGNRTPSCTGLCGKLVRVPIGRN